MLPEFQTPQRKSLIMLEAEFWPLRPINAPLCSTKVSGSQGLRKTTGRTRWFEWIVFDGALSSVPNDWIGSDQRKVQ